MYSKTLTLSNGVVVPQLALGTWFIDDALAAEAVRQAVKIGYRHVDTAQAYANERGVGEGVRTAGIPREELFVTTKVAAEHKDYESAARSIDESLAAMGLDYLDMMIIHSPQPWVEVNQSDDRTTRATSRRGVRSRMPTRQARSAPSASRTSRRRISTTSGTTPR
jgi:diketogulonate reductase-like aldo/keto reductase